MRLKSIGARTAAWYACAATATLACLFAAGYQFLQSHLVHGLDLMNEAEFHQIEAHLGPDYATMSAPFMEVRIRDIADFSCWAARTSTQRCSGTSTTATMNNFDASIANPIISFGIKN